MKWTRPLRYFSFSVLSGLLLWAGWPENGYTPLLFVAFVPLLLIDSELIHGERPRSGLKFFGYAFLAMLLWNTATTWWIYNSTAEGAIFALLLNSVLMSLVWFFFHRIRKVFGPIPGYASFVFFWIAFEYLHLRWDLSWPWLNLGNGFATRVQWIQWYEYTGTLGGTLWMLLSNLLIYLFVKGVTGAHVKRIRILNSSLSLGSTLLLIAVPILISLHLYKIRTDQGAPCHVVVVQPNVDPYNEKFNGTSDEQLNKFILLASERADANTDFVVGPETAMPDGIWEEEIYYHPQIHKLLKWISRYPRLNLVIGMSSFKAFEPGEKRSETAREFTDGKGYYDAFNSAMMIDRFGAIQIYHKTKLVPGVEKMPYPEIFGSLEKYALKLGGISGSLGVEKVRHPLVSSEGMPVAPAICYESVFGDFLATYFRKGAEILFIITNDGWWKNTPGHRQHFEYARLRAIEFRKSVARSANTGISCFINQRGDVLKQTRWWKDDSISETLYLNKKVTFYAHYGDYIGFISTFFSALLLLLLIFRYFVSLK